MRSLSMRIPARHFSEKSISSTTQVAIYARRVVKLLSYVYSFLSATARYKFRRFAMLVVVLLGCVMRHAALATENHL